MESPTLPTDTTAATPLASDPFEGANFELNWSRQDVEQRFGFRGGRFTSVNKALSFCIGVILTVIFYAAAIVTADRVPEARWFTSMFLQRGICPYPTMLFFFWATSILWLKRRKLKLQCRALEIAAVPQQPDFELTPATARLVLERLHRLVDDTASFMLFNRLERALSNLKNIGQVSDVSSILKTQADNDENYVASSYSLVNGFIWAIPVLGFIGTVLGLSQAIAAFGLTLQAGADMSAIKHSLEAVTAGLATAFETTLIALVAALIIHMRTTFLQSRESEFLDACSDYCHKTVASRLRLTSAATA